MSRKAKPAHVQRDDLVAALAACAPAARPLPGTTAGAAVVSVRDGKLRVQVGSPDLLVRREEPADAGTLAPTLCSHKWLLRLAKALPKGGVDLTATDSMLHLSSTNVDGELTLGLNTFADDVEPVTLGVPDDPAAVVWTEVSSADLLPALRTAVAAASTDQQRAVLCAVSVTPTSITATDSYRLHSTAVDLPTLEPALWPRDFAAEVAKLDADEHPTIRLGRVGSVVVVAAGPSLWASPQVQGEYPAFDSLWPAVPPPDGALDVLVDRPNLGPVVERFVDLSGDQKVVRVAFGDGITVSAAVRGEVSGEQRLEPGIVGGKLPADGWQAGFNAAFLAQALGVFGSVGSVRMVQHDPGKPAVLSADEHPSRVLLMPVRLP